MNQTRIAIAIWDGVEELDYAGPYEVLTAWGAMSEGRTVTVRTVAETRDGVRCAHGLQVVPDVAWPEIDGLDVFVLPGGNSRSQLEDDGFIARVRRLADAGTLMT